MQNKLREELISIVNNINNRYEALKKLSNDELREKSRQIEIKIKDSKDQEKALNDYLPDVFAVIKDTARRFAEGNIVVLANDNDKKLADDFDFVRIEGDKAIYRNRWDAGGQPVLWNMIHYDEQLMGGILLHRGYAVEMATGEGKTLVATLPVFLNALTHRGVHLMTVNDYLSKRDYEITRPIYMFHGLSANCIEYYTRDDRRKKEAYLADITFGTNSSFAFDYLFDHLEITPDACIQRQHNYAIIDELDSILIDDADEPHIIGGGNYYDNSKIYKENINLIRELIKNKQLYDVNLLTKSAGFTAEGKKWLEHKTGIQDLYTIKRTYEIENFDILPAEEKDGVKRKLHLQNVFLQLLIALTLYERDIDYIVEDGKVIIVDQHTGRPREGNRWEYGLHTAVEIKEEVAPEADFDGMGVISLKNYFRLYNKICGMSGTIMPVEDELAEIYNLKCAALPTHKPCIREDKSLQIFKTSEEKDIEIVKNILNNQKQGRPSLVGCISIKRSDAIGELLKEKGIKFNKLDAKTTKDEALTVAKAGIGNIITVSTSVAGRGTDIKPSNDALENGGLVVIGTDLFESVRVDRQLRGRTGRQGNPGTSIFFASLDDFILKNLEVEDKQRLKDTIARINDENFNIPEIRYFFEKAQSNREKYFKSMRKETARKDDIVAPHRLKFYNQRNNVLFDAKASDSIISKVIYKSNHTQEEVTEHLQELYLKTKELVIRSTWNNKNRQETNVPFSVNQQPFAILFKVKKLIQYGFEYFSHEYQRQNILQVYDKQWKHFVLYMMGNLDSKEIDMLNDKYNAMMDEIDSVLLSRILNATTPFECRKSVLEPDFEKKEISDSPKKFNPLISSDALCPCKSGKKYGECHGSNIHRINSGRRRRR